MIAMRRRRFLALIAATSAVGATLPLARLAIERRSPGLIRFRGTAGLPAAKLPAYATYVVEGTIDPAAQSGQVTTRVLAGAPDTMSAIDLPGLAQTISVDSVEEHEGILHIRGTGASEPTGADREVRLDLLRRVGWAPFAGTEVLLHL